MPCDSMPAMTQFSIRTFGPMPPMLMPIEPPWPFTDNPLRRIELGAPLIVTPSLPDRTLIPAYTPGAAMIDTDCEIVTGPYPAESRTMTSPFKFVTPIASLNARQGFVIEQLNAVLAGDPYDATKAR